MRKQVLLLALCPLLANAQVVFQEDFEGYAPGNRIAEHASGNWTTWNAAPGTPEDAVATGKFAHSGSTSAEILGSTTNGPVDLALDFDGLTGGHYQLTFWIRMEQKAGGYFNLLHNGDLANLSFALETTFNNDGTGFLTVNSEETPFAYEQGQWNEVKFDIDMDADQAEFLLNGASVHQWPWSAEANSAQGPNRLDRLDFYAAAHSNTAQHFQIDDIKLEAATTLGVSDVLSNTTGVYPTPARNMVTVDLASALGGNATVEMFDVAGARMDVPATVTSNAVSFNIARLQVGVYFVRINDGGEAIVKKVVKN
jgi:hypothetical protein